MMSTSTIQAMSAEAAERAAAEDLKPFVTWPEDVGRIRRTQRIPFPNLGSHRPDGWTLQDTYLVDKTGWGEESEPALTIEQFLRVVEEFMGHGWAIVEEGQFQVVMGRFTKT